MMSERTCGICVSTFANKTQKENHRRAVHPGQRDDGLEDDDLDYGEVPSFDVIEDGAVKILGQRNGLYLMQYEDSVQWLSLSDENAMVKEFKEDRNEEKKQEEEELPLITRENLQNWLKNKVISDDYVVENDFFK